MCRRNAADRQILHTSYQQIGRLLNFAENYFFPFLSLALPATCRVVARRGRKSDKNKGWSCILSAYLQLSQIGRQPKFEFSNFSFSKNEAWISLLLHQI
jgi:hypothetical protein